ncbi:CHAT domain-containing protein [Aquimarina sp. 433]
MNFLKNKKQLFIKNITVAVFFIFHYHPITAQKISKRLDSIHKLEVNKSEKIKLYDALISRYEKLNNYTQLGSDAHQIAEWLHINTNTKQKAIEMVQTAIDARIKAIPFNPDLLKRSYNNLGLYYFKGKQYQASIKVYKTLIKVTATDFLIGRGYYMMGRNFNKLEDPYQAITYFQKAQYYFKNDKKYLSKNHYQLSKAYRIIRSRKNSEKVLYHLKTSEKLLLENNKIDYRRLFNINNEIGRWYFEQLQDTLNGEKYFKKADKITQNINDIRYQAVISYNLGLTYIDRDNLAAKQYIDISYKKFLEAKMELKLPYFGMGLLANSNKNYIQAEEYYYKCLSEFFESTISYDTIDNFLTKEKLTDIKDRMFLLEILKYAIDNYIDWGIKANNSSYHQKAIRLVKVSDRLINLMLESTNSDNSKLLWRSIASGTYASGIQASLEADDIDYGFFLSEKNKALLLQQEILKENSSIPSDFIEYERSLQRELISLQKEQERSNSVNDSLFMSLLFDKQEELYHLRDSIKTLYPDYIKERQSSALLTPLSDIVIKDNEIVMQYMMTERIAGIFPNTYCLVLSKDAKKLFKLENTKDLHDKIFTLRALLNKPFRNQEDILNYKKRATTLYHSLFPEEIRPLLKNKKITIVPDHLLSNLPFEALITDTGNYLLEENEISYTYSLSFQKQNTERKRNSNEEFLGIAPKDFKNDLTSLPNSIQEIKSGIKQYSGKLLQNEEATKDNFIKEIKDYKIVHLATHAFASDSITPWISFKNEKITNAEIDLLRNNADMVVLSACNTSLGEVHSGEGVLSLARSFFKSGANTVIPSLWSTNDKATATITADFYKNLSEGQTKSAALRTAKLNYLQSNTDAEASPHYWASMILIGDTGTLLPQSNNLWIFLLGFGIIAAIALSLYVYKRVTRV